MNLKTMNKEALIQKIEDCMNVSELNRVSLDVYLPFTIINETDDSDFIGYVLVPTVPYTEGEFNYIGVKIPFSKIIPDEGYEQLQKEEMSGLTKEEFVLLITDSRKKLTETETMFAD